jgi:crotonobetainyl-CoA:carnitine CoA-transferase CaiB-like acyl-CoA transferase
VNSSEQRQQINVLHLGVGLSTALVSKLFADLGAVVHRVPPPKGDPFEATCPGLTFWHAAFTEADFERRELADLLAWADVCVTGGEDHPGLERRYDAAALAHANPHLVVVDITGDTRNGTPANEILVQAQSGLVREMLTDRPIAFALRPGVYGAGLAGACGAWAALLERQKSGCGQLVRTSMMQGLALFFPEIWTTAQYPDTKFDNVYPRDVQQLIFECADGTYIQVVLGVPGAVARLYNLLGIDVEVDPTDPGRLDLTRGPRGFFADFDLIAPYVKRFTRADLLPQLWEIGLGAEPVLKPGECWDDDQTVASGVLAERDGYRFIGRVTTITPVDPSPGSSPRAEIAPDRGLGPLDGIRVVDFGNFIAGPMVGRILSDLGADVVKVDPAPLVPPIGAWRTRLAGNRGKRRVALDLKSEAGYAAARRLVDTADVVMHNFRVGVPERLRIDPATLRESNPDLVSLETTAYGKSGPKARNTGFDMVMQALMGIEYRAGGTDNPPLWARTPAVDFAAAALGAAGVMAAVYRRNQTGQGSEVQVDLSRTSLLLMADMVQTPEGAFAECPPLDSKQLGFHPAERLYETADGWVGVAALDETMASALLQVLGLAPGFGSRRHWGADEAETLEAAVRTWETEALVKELQGHDVWCAAVPEDGWTVLANDPVAWQQQLVVELDDPVFGLVRTWMGAIVNFSRSLSLTAPRATLAPPGAHTHEVLLELGYGDGEAAALVGRVVGEVIT